MNNIIDLFVSLIFIAGSYYLYKNGKKYKDVAIFNLIVQAIFMVVTGSLASLLKTSILTIIVTFVLTVIGCLIQAKIYELAYNKSKSPIGYVGWAIVYALVYAFVMVFLITLLSGLSLL